MNEIIQKIPAISIFVHDSISVSEGLVVDLIIVRLITTWKVSGQNGTVVSVTEYRKLLGDYKSTDEQIVERLQFLEAFCRNIIKPIIKTYARTKQGSP